MNVISNKNSDLLSQSDNINEDKIPILEVFINLPPQIRDTPHQKMLINTMLMLTNMKLKDFFI